MGDITRNAIASLLVVVLLAGCADKTPVAQTPVTPVVTTRTVLYEAEGPASTGPRTADYTLRSDDGGSRQGDIDLPLKNQDGGAGLTFTGFDSGDFVFLSIQNGDEYGSVTCRITIKTVTGTETTSAVISENTSSGGFTTATCQGQVP